MLTPSQLAKLIELNAYAVTTGYDFIAEPDEEVYRLFEKTDSLATRLVGASEQILALVIDELKQIDSDVDADEDYREIAEQLDICLESDKVRLKTPFGKALEDKFSDLLGGPSVDAMAALAFALDGVDEAKNLLR